MRIVLVGGPAHGIVLDLDGSPAHITAFHERGQREVYELSEKQDVPGAVVYAPTFMDWADFLKALKKVQALNI